MFDCFLKDTSNSNQSNADSKALSGAGAAAATTAATPAVHVNNQTTNEKASNTANPSGGYAANKKDEIKIVPTVLPVLGYTAAPQNIYQPPMESGVQFVAGAQQTQPASFSTTYQQGVS